MRVVSLVPAATQLLCALGLRDTLVGVTHECAGTADLAGLEARVLTRSRIPSGVAGSVIDGAVKTAAANRNAVQVLDARLLAQLAPDVVLAPPDRPGPPSACSVSVDEVRRGIASCATPPRVVTYGPSSLRDVLGSMRAVGEALDRGADAARLVAEHRARIEAVRATLSRAWRTPRVALLAWVQPPIGGGGLLAELVHLAGGEPVAAHPTEVARGLDWKELVALAPDFLVLAPCGLPLERAKLEAESLAKVEGLAALPAVRWGQVHVVDGQRTFSPAGVETVRALEILAVLVHPEMPWPDALLPGRAARPVLVD